MCEREVTHQIVTVAKISLWHFRHVLQVVWLKKGLQNGGSRAPQDPLASPLLCLQNALASQLSFQVWLTTCGMLIGHRNPGRSCL